MDILYDLILPGVATIKSYADSLSSQEAILVSAILATLGWTQSNRLTRKLNRKQHTMSVMLKDENLQKGLTIVRPYVKEGRYPLSGTKEHDCWQTGLRACLNYYEFLCVGILRKDFDEKLVRMTERYTLVTLHQYASNYITHLRELRPQGDKSSDRSQIYMALEKIAKRWEKPWMRFP